MSLTWEMNTVSKKKKWNVFLIEGDTSSRLKHLKLFYLRDRMLKVELIE